MRIRLLKSWTHYGKKYPVNQIINTTEKLVEQGIAEPYNGPYPPRKKVKMNLRDLKINT
jgi:hypothetical protein